MAKKSDLLVDKSFGYCLVCKVYEATGNHYNVLSCEGCKGHFRRQLLKENIPKCYNNGQCIENREFWIRCSACRHKRCLDAGMRAEAIRRQTKSIKEKIKIDLIQLTILSEDVREHLMSIAEEYKGTILREEHLPYIKINEFWAHAGFNQIGVDLLLDYIHKFHLFQALSVWDQYQACSKSCHLILFLRLIFHLDNKQKSLVFDTLTVRQESRNSASKDIFNVLRTFKEFHIDYVEGALLTLWLLANPPFQSREPQKLREINNFILGLFDLYSAHTYPGQPFRSCSIILKMNLLGKMIVPGIIDFIDNYFKHKHALGLFL